MQKLSALLGLVLAAAASSGCSAVMLLAAGGVYAASRRAMPTAAVDPATAARGRWDCVMRLPSGSTIDVLLMDGAYVGQLIRADGYNVWLLLDGVDVPIRRVDVLRIDLIELPGAVSGIPGGQPALLARRSIPIYLAEDQRLLLDRLQKRDAPIESKARQVESPDALAEARLEAFALEMAKNAARATVAAMMKVFVGRSAAPLLQFGAPALPFGGARSLVVSQPRIAMPAPFGGAPAIVSRPIPPASRSRSRPAICHSEPVPLQGRARKHREP